MKDGKWKMEKLKNGRRGAIVPTVSCAEMEDGKWKMETRRDKVWDAAGMSGSRSRAYR
jgi:hypothetical protein